MELTISVRQTDNGFRAASGHPMPSVAEAATRDEALARLRFQIERQLENQVEFFTWHFPDPDGGKIPIWPDDEFTQSWLDGIAEYRRECDEAERMKDD